MQVSNMAAMFGFILANCENKLTIPGGYICIISLSSYKTIYSIISVLCFVHRIHSLAPWHNFSSVVVWELYPM